MEFRIGPHPKGEFNPDTMKRISIFALLLPILLGGFVHGQLRQDQIREISVSRPGTEILLAGTWLLDHAGSSDSVLVFNRCQSDRFCWGTFLSFQANGQLSAGYSAPCGNDPNLRYFEGKWFFRATDQTLKLSTDTDGKPGRFQLKRSGPDQFQLHAAI